MDPSLRMLVTLLPEIILIAMATWMFLGAAFSRQPSNWLLTAVLALGVSSMALGFMNWYGMSNAQLAGAAPPISSGPVALDALSLGVRGLALFSGLVLAGAAAFGGGRRLSGEYLGCLLMAVAGVMLASAAMDLVFLFLALELISIPTYILLFLGRSDRASGEASIKYFLLSIVSSAILLYGFTLIYGAAGSTSLPEIAASLRGAPQPTLITGLALVLVVAGLCFKIAAVPFHFYAPDVYQGATSGNAGVLAVLPKIAGIVVLVRLVAVSLPGVESYGWQLAVVIAALTMTLGNLAALWQNNIRRMLAYSSIAHSGYMLIGLATAFALAETNTGRGSGLASMLFYLAVYVIATAGTFAALAYLGSREREVNHVDELSGLLQTHPAMAIMISIFMFSLTGIPPLAGFWGKLSLIGGVLYAAWDTGGPVRAWLIALAIIAVLNAAASAGYYLRIVSVMCFGSAAQRVPAAGPRGALAGAGLCAALVLLVGVLPGWLLKQSRSAGRAAITTSQTYDALGPAPQSATETAMGDSAADAVQ